MTRDLQQSLVFSSVEMGQYMNLTIHFMNYCPQEGIGRWVTVDTTLFCQQLELNVLGGLRNCTYSAGGLGNSDLRLGCHRQPSNN